MNSELAGRAAVTLGALLVYRVGTFIPLPGIDLAVWEQIFRSQSGGLLGAASLLSGGAVARLAIFALSLTPYLTAAVIVQLLTLSWPRLRALAERGDRGRRTIWQYTLVLTLLLAMFQAWGVASGLEGITNLVIEPGFFFRCSIIATLTGGTFFLVWLSELITVRGVGNGLALILFVGIVTQIPSSFVAMLELGRQGVLSSDLLLGLGVLAVALIGFIVFVELARRQVPIKYGRREVAGQTIEESSSTLLMKVNGAGIVPFVITTWLVLVPLLLLLTMNLFVLASSNGPVWLAEIAGQLRPAQIWLATAVDELRPGHSAFVICMIVAIVFFALLYVALLIDPDQVAEKLKRYGGVVPGIEPGEATADHIDYVLSRTTVLGGVYLLIVCLIPEILIAYARVPFYLGGVSALVMVCTVLDVNDQMQGRKFIRNLEERQS
jgi:preprotein translocase subunit SecY